MSILRLSPWIKFLKLTPKASLPRVGRVRTHGRYEKGWGAAWEWQCRGLVTLLGFDKWFQPGGFGQITWPLFFFFSTWPLYTLPTSPIKWQRCPLPWGPGTRDSAGVAPGLWMPGVAEEEGPPSSTDATFRDAGGGQWGGWMCRIVNQCRFPHELALCVGGWAGEGDEGWISVPPSGALPQSPTRTAPPIM